MQISYKLLLHAQFDGLPVLKSFTFQGGVNSGEEKKNIWPCLGSKGVDTPVECDFWLRVAVQVGLVAQMRCEFLMHQTAVTLVIYG